MRRNYRKKNAKPIFRKMNASKVIAKKKRSNLVSLIKQINIKQAERKYKSTTVTTGEMNHNQIYQFHIWGGSGVTTFDALPGQGNNDATRVGDRILLEGYKVRAIFQIPGDRKTTTVAIYWCPHNSDQGDPSSDLLHNVTGNTMVDPMQKKRYPGAKLIGKYRVKAVDSEETSGEWSNATNSMPIYCSFWIPINKKVFFIADASTTPSNLKEYGTICIAPYQTYSALATDTIVVDAQLNATAYFKDL